jgi:dinuclear metal center YbgI/SA1388 family protein
MNINSRKIIQWLEKLFPKDLAEDWDNVGFLLGNADKTIKKILIALEVTPEVVTEAIDKNVDLIITHHPLIFKGIKRLVDHNPHEKMIRQLIFNDIHVYAAHTNADIADGGLSDMLLELLKLKATEGLLSVGRSVLLHSVVYVPVESVEAVRHAIHQAGGGAIGSYSQCSFMTEGVGQFMPGLDAHPAIGTVGILERVKEIKLEFVAPLSLKAEIEGAILRSHPYETPAYVMMEMKNSSKEHYLGRIAALKAPMTLKELAEWLKKELKISHLRIVGNPKALVQRIGVLTGAGDEATQTAKAKRCDVLITGDIKYHPAQEALSMGMPLIDMGHYNSEIIFKTVLRDRMVEAFERLDYDVTIEVSSAEKDPFLWI